MIQCGPKCSPNLINIWQMLGSHNFGVKCLVYKKLGANFGPNFDPKQLLRKFGSEASQKCFLSWQVVLIQFFPKSMSSLFVSVLWCACLMSCGY